MKRLISIALVFMSSQAFSAEFAELDSNNIVLRVIVADSAFIATQPGRWVESNAAVYKNAAAIGYTFDEQRQAFLAPKQFPSWVFNESTYRWDPPVPRPPYDGNFYRWDEPSTSWVLIK